MHVAFFRVVATALLISGAIFGLDEYQEREASLKLNRAFRAYYAEKPVAAARGFEEYLKIKGENEVALRYLARIALSSGDMTSATLYLERAIKADQSGNYSLQLLSEIYLKQNKLDDAARVLALILKTDPLNERALQVMAYIYQQKNDPRQAATYYKRLIIAVQKGSGNPDVMAQALYFLGNYYYQQDNFPRSLQYFRKLHEIDSDNGRYLLIIGELQKITGQFRQSAATHEKLIERQPDFAQAYESLAETYFVLSDPRALPTVKKFRKLKKDEKPGILEGIEQLLSGKEDEALRAFDQILGANQNRMSARLGRYRIFARRANHAEARNEAFAVVVIAQRLNGYEVAREYAHITLDYLNRQAKDTNFRERFFVPAHTIGETALDAAAEQLAIDFVELYTTHATTLENTNERGVAITYQELAAQTIEQLQIWYQTMLKNPKLTADKQQLAKLEKRIREAHNQLYQTRVSQAWSQVNLKGGIGDAIKTADTAVAIEKEYATAYFVKGIIHNNLAEKNTTEAHAGAASAAGTKSAASLAEYKTAARYFEMAIDITELKSKKKVAPANYYFYSGMALEKINEFGKAEKQLKRTIELDPYNPTYLNYLGYIYSLRNMNLQEANSLVLRALEDDPENEAYLDTFGWIQFKLGNYREALEQLTVAASFAQKKSAVDPVIYFHLAEVHSKMNNRVTAVEYYIKTRNDIKKASEPMDLDYINAQIKKLESENKQSKKGEEHK